MAGNGNGSGEGTTKSHRYTLIVKQDGEVLSSVTTTCTCPNDGDHTQIIGK